MFSFFEYPISIILLVENVPDFKIQVAIEKIVIIKVVWDQTNFLLT
jgi:hypothetical protein